MVSLIIPAAGQGKRMGLGYNKIFTDITDKPILMETLLKFTRCERIDEIIIAAEAKEMDFIRTIISKIPWKKNIKIVVGGTQRQYSVANALGEVSEESQVVLVHDAARPNISTEVINQLIEAVYLYGAVAVGVPVKDTTAIVNDENYIQTIPPREHLWSIQTPQGFRTGLLKAAFDKAKEDDFLGTDETSLIIRLPHEVKLIQGDYTNIKITTPSDLVMSQLLFGKQAGTKVKDKLSDLFNSAVNIVQNKRNDQ